MHTFSSFESVVDHLSTLGGQGRKRVVIANGHDEGTLEAVKKALKAGFIDAIFVGSCPEVDAELEHFGSHIAMHPVGDEAETARVAVAMARGGQADIVMKGLIHTDVLLHAALDKQCGLLEPGRVMTHVAACKVPSLGRLLFFTDPAVIPEPTMPQRVAQVEYLVSICRQFGIEEPRIGLVHFTENLSSRFPCTADYQELRRMAESGTWGKAIVDGPLDVRCCVDPVALKTKGISSPLQGQANALVFPNLEAGNAFYKTISFFAQAQMAGMLCGTTSPIILSSRGDDAATKYYSMALAAMM